MLTIRDDQLIILNKLCYYRFVHSIYIYVTTNFSFFKQREPENEVKKYIWQTICYLLEYSIKSPDVFLKYYLGLLIFGDRLTKMESRDELYDFLENTDSTDYVRQEMVLQILTIEINSRTDI